MRFFLISDNIDTQIGLRLAGIKGVVVHEREEVLKVLEEVLKDDSVGVILMTQKIAELIPDELEELKLSPSLPLVFVIPDRHGWRGEKDFITRYIEEAIGVKISGENR
jgi:V/A-type H+-transporting ATPase subunit F